MRGLSDIINRLRNDTCGHWNFGQTKSVLTALADWLQKRKYFWMYRIGLTPWERYRPIAEARLSSLLDEVAEARSQHRGRALDIGCGRGQYTPGLARHGWEAVGIDHVPDAIHAAREQDVPGVSYVLGEVTELESAGLGKFDLFIDIGCFQGLNVEQRAAEARGVTTLATQGASLLMLAFGHSRYSRIVEGVSQQEVLTVFREWELITVESAETAGLGWPMNRSSPKWYWFQYRSRLADRGK